MLEFGWYMLEGLSSGWYMPSRVIDLLYPGPSSDTAPYLFCVTHYSTCISCISCAAQLYQLSVLSFHIVTACHVNFVSQEKLTMLWQRIYFTGAATFLWYHLYPNYPDTCNFSFCFHHLCSPNVYGNHMGYTNKCDSHMSGNCTSMCGNHPFIESKAMSVWFLAYMGRTNLFWKHDCWITVLSPLHLQWAFIQFKSVGAKLDCFDFQAFAQLP